MIRIINADVMDGLRQLPDKSVQCVVTSPPYWALRDYGVEGQIGLEKTPEEYVQRMVEVFREVRRVLRDDGTVWLNLGSSFANTTIESERYILRDDISLEEHSYAIGELGKHLIKESEAMPPLQETNASTEQNVPGMLQEKDASPGELSSTPLQKMRQDLHSSQKPSGARAGEILFNGMCPFRFTNTEKDISHCTVPDLRQIVQQIQCGGAEEQGATSLLQLGLLVQLQSEREPLSMVRGSRWADESLRGEVAEIGTETGSISLQDMSCISETGGTSYPPICELRGCTVGHRERDNSLPRLPCQIQKSGKKLRRDINFYCINPGYGLAGITLHKKDIPPHILSLFKPEYSLKPKDDTGIPWRVAFALQADGWYLRSDIIWSKPNPMPESVTDRPTKSHEYVFLLTKKARYYYDADAVREAHTDEPHVRGQSKKDDTKMDAGCGWQKYTNGEIRPTFHNPAGRNRRTVWEIATQPFPGSHFATMPEALVEPCIKAGTSERGCCSVCGAPWVRVVEENEDYKIWAKTQRFYGSGGEGSAFRLAKTNSKTAPIKNTTIGGRPSCTCDGKLIKKQTWVNFGDKRMYKAIEQYEPDGEMPIPIPCTVLDPFGGSGTVAKVARDLKRDAILIELSADYIKIAEGRLRLNEQLDQFCEVKE